MNFLNIIFVLTIWSAAAHAAAQRFHTTLALGAGYIQFPDIQVPENKKVALPEQGIVEMRGDGSVIGPENSMHQGLPISGQASARFQIKRWSLIGRGSFLHSAAIGAPWTTSTATYGRYDLGLGLRYGFPIQRDRVALELDLTRRKTSFLNGSIGHYVKTIMPGVFVELKFGRSYKLRGGYHTAAGSLGFKAPDETLSGDFPNANATLSDWLVQGSYRILPGRWLALRLQWEQTEIDIPDIDQYRSFAMNVRKENATQTFRSYRLNTQIISFTLEQEL